MVQTSDTATDVERFPEVVREAWSLFEALRRMGYPADAIFFTDKIAPNQAALDRGEGLLGVKLEWREKVFSAFVGPPSPDWGPQIELFNHAPEQVLQRVWNASRAKSQSAALLAGLKAKGMYPP